MIQKKIKTRGNPINAEDLNKVSKNIRGHSPIIWKLIKTTSGYMPYDSQENNNSSTKITLNNPTLFNQREKK